MKRKSLLVAMASVSLAAIGIGATSTMAWFTATTSVGVDSVTDGEITALVHTGEGTVSVDGITVALSFELDDDFEGKSLQLAQYGALNAAKTEFTDYTNENYATASAATGATVGWAHAYLRPDGSTYVWNASTTPAGDNYNIYGGSKTAANNVDYFVYKVKATFDISADQYAGLQDTTLTVPVALQEGTGTGLRAWVADSIETDGSAVPEDEAYTGLNVTILINKTTVASSGNNKVLRSEEQIGVYARGDLITTANASTKATGTLITDYNE